MKVLLLTLVGLVVAVFVTGGFQVFASDVRRRRRGQRKGGFARRAVPRRPGPRVQAGRPPRGYPSGVSREAGLQSREFRVDLESLGLDNCTALSPARSRIWVPLGPFGLPHRFR